MRRAALISVVVISSIAHAEADPAQRAQQHFARAEAADKAGDYKTAIREYRLAYEIKPHAAVLYNIAVDEEKLDDSIAAANDYQRYIDESDELEDADSVRKKIYVLRTKAGTRLVNQALAAKGGAARLAQVKTITIRGVFKVTTPAGDRTGTLVRYIVGRTHARSELHFSDGKEEVEVVTPDASWVVRDGHAFSPAKQDELEARTTFWRDKDMVLMRTREEGAIAQAMGPTHMGDRDLDLIVITRADGTAKTRIYLDPSTHLIAVLEGETYAGQVHAEIGDHRDVSGIKFPHRSVSHNGFTTLEIQTDTIELDKEIPRTYFDRPPP